jgi:glycosyltransferase involved in cell wall biosynthesis
MHRDAQALGFFEEVTPIVLTFNEAPNIGRCLERLQGFREVLIVDSGSTDETLTIVRAYANARIVTRPFDSFSGQWNFAIREGGVRTEWALAMDADYILTDAVLAELNALAPEPDTMGYRISFEYCVFGKQLSRTLYPPIIALYRHKRTHYIQDGHCMRAVVSGRIDDLRQRVQHDDRKPLSRWLGSQAKYADQECALLLSKQPHELRVQDRLRRMMVITPWLVPLYCLSVGRGIFDGWAGLYYALQRGLAEGVLALKLMEARLQTRRD